MKPRVKLPIALWSTCFERKGYVCCIIVNRELTLGYLWAGEAHLPSLRSRELCLVQCSQDGWARRPQGDFLLQQGISAGDRASVVDSMTRVATQLQLPSDDLFLAVACLDRFLAAGSLQPCFLDAAALACLWLATKFEHRLGPSALQFLAAAQLDCTSRANRSLLIDMEARILKVGERDTLHSVLSAEQHDATGRSHPAAGSVAAEQP